MELREPQKLSRSHKSQHERRVDKVGMNSKPEDFKLELQSNSWLRISEEPVALIEHDGFCEESTLLEREE